MRYLRLVSLLFLAPAVLAQSADLRVSLTMPSTAFSYGASGSGAWGMLTLTNAGNVPAQDVTLEFRGGLNAAYFPFKSACKDQFTRCAYISIVPGTWTVPISAEWRSATAPGIVETTSVTVSSSSTPDPDYTNNTASANTTILWQSDLRLDSLDVPSSVASGKSAAIGASISDHGPSPSLGVTMTISMPPGARYEGFLGDWLFRCTEPPAGKPGDLVCTVPDYYRITNNSVQALVSIDPSLAPGTVLPLNATLTSTTAAKPLTASGTLTAAAPSSPDAAVTVTATLDKPVLPAGYSAWETYTVTNAGPRDAEIVTVDIRPLGGGADWVGHPSLGSCSGDGPIHCTIATLPAGATMTLMVLERTYWQFTGTLTSTAVATWLHGGTAVASNELLVMPSQARRRPAHH